MGKRERRREKLTAPTAAFEDPEAGTLILRGSLTAGSRREYAAVVAAGLHREDAWQRAVEFLFERLAVTWTISEVEFTAQKELLGRFRVASATERRFVREALRAHLADRFPDLDAP